MQREQKENFPSLYSGLNLKSYQSDFTNIQFSEPLWKRAPTRDESGRPYSDFMMLIPGLKNFEPAYLKTIVNKLDTILKGYEKYVVFADLNLKINILWVTIQPHVGLSTEIAALIHHVVPEAKLVSQDRAS